MNQEKQPEALRLADLLEYISNNSEDSWQAFDEAAAELRRLHAQNTEQRAELVAEAARTAEEKLRADQMTEQHRMQCNIRKEVEDENQQLRGQYDAAASVVAELQSQLSAIGAGGVEALRKPSQETLLAQHFNAGREFEAERIASLQAAPPAPAAVAVPDGFALVPKRLTRAMERVLTADEEGWQWEDLLAAAEAITEQEYAALAVAPAQAVPHCGTCNDHGAVGNILTAEPCPDCTPQEHATQLAGMKPRTPGSFVNAAGIRASDMPATVVRKLDAAFHDAVTFADTPAQTQGCTRSHPHENMSPMCVLRTEIARSNHAAAVAQARDPFQQRVQPWLLACFGAEIAGDKQERNHRFLEEAVELVQANGCTASEAHQLVDYVFGRPVGEPAQEVGGVIVTLAALCLASGLDMHQAGEVELARIWGKVEQIRAKQAAKPKHSPLPAAPAAPAVDAREVERDAAFEAVRQRLCGLQRYSFVLDDDGVVRRVQDRTGSWIEFDDAHELFDPVAVDAAIAAQAKGGA